MDRKLSKDVIAEICIFIMLISSYLVSVWKFYTNTQRIAKEQLNELLTIYSEETVYIKEMIVDYNSLNNRRFVVFAVVLGVFMVLIFLTLHIVWNLWKRRFIRHQNNYADALISQMGMVMNMKKVERGADNFDASMNGADYWNALKQKLLQLEYSLIDTQEKLKLEEQTSKKLITDLTHQLKTPLASLKMCHELATESQLTEEERASFILRERQEINKLESLLEELIKLSRLENHMIQLNKMPISVRQFILEGVNQIYMKANRKRIDIIVDIKSECVFHVDKKWMQEAFVNVLDNAIKYSQEGKDIKIRVEELVTVVLIEVEDQGIGIQANEMHKIFQRFYRAPQAQIYNKEGIGVGLYLTRKIIEEEGGSIRVKRQAVGSLFQITLPK